MSSLDIDSVAKLRGALASRKLAGLPPAEARLMVEDLSVRMHQVISDARHVDHDLISRAMVQLHQAATGEGADDPAWVG